MPQAVREAQFSDVDELSASLRPVDAEILPLQRQDAASWSVGSADLSGSSLWWGFLGARSCAFGSATTALIGVAGSDANDWTLNRMPMGEREAFFIPPGKEFACSIPTPGSYLFLAAPDGWLETQAKRQFESGLALGDAPKTFALGPGALEWRHALSAVRRFARAYPQYVAGEHTGGCLQRKLLAVLVDALSPGTDRSEAAGARTVSRLLEWLDAHRDVPLHQDDLCRALGRSPRSLRRVFGETFGTSPARFLRVWRLRLARRALLARECLSVTEAAVRFGFFDLGRFASSYRAIFGELPSDSLRRVGIEA